MAFGWLLSTAAVSSVIAGATSPEQVRANVAASTMRLDEAELKDVVARLEAAES